MTYANTFCSMNIYVYLSHDSLEQYDHRYLLLSLSSSPSSGSFLFLSLLHRWQFQEYFVESIKWNSSISGIGCLFAGKQKKYINWMLVQLCNQTLTTSMPFTMDFHGEWMYWISRHTIDIISSQICFLLYPALQLSYYLGEMSNEVGFQIAFQSIMSDSLITVIN